MIIGTILSELNENRKQKLVLEFSCLNYNNGNKVII